MKHLKNYELFLESASHRKYEIAVFNQDFIVENIFGGEDKIINITIKKGEKVKLFFDKDQTTDDKFVINAIRPVEVSQNESKEFESESVNLSELWEANFILNTPMEISKTDSPFDIENYL